MTVYRRNPLLMTVMGANPGQPRRRLRHFVADHRTMSEVGHLIEDGDLDRAADVIENHTGRRPQDGTLRAKYSGMTYGGEPDSITFRNPIDHAEQQRLYALAKNYHRDGLDAARRGNREELKEAMGELHALTAAAQQLGPGWFKTAGGARDTKLSIEISLLHNDLHEAGAQAGLWQSFFHGARFAPKDVLPNPGKDKTYLRKVLWSRARGPVNFVMLECGHGGENKTFYPKTEYTCPACKALKGIKLPPGMQAQFRGRMILKNNPLGEAIVGGVAGALVNRAFQSNPGPAFVVIDSETGRVMYTKRATGMGNEAINNCVAVARGFARKFNRSYIVFLDIRGLKIGMSVNVPMVRALGITEEIHPGDFNNNPAISSSWDGLKFRPRLAILEFAGIPFEQAKRLATRPWGTLPPDIRSEVAKGWQENPRERGLRPASATVYCSACGTWNRSNGPYRKMKVGELAGKRLCDQCYRGFHSGRRSGASWAKNPQPNPGPSNKRRLTMTIERFARWVKSKRDPAMWKAFLAKFRGYEKWTHGAKARKVTVEWVDTPGVNGLWITYDGGKQPESTYIMPKGSPRKGAWKHPWDTMPDIKHDPEAKIVITKLRGSSKITDFYHK